MGFAARKRPDAVGTSTGPLTTQDAWVTKYPHRHAVLESEEGRQYAGSREQQQSVLDSVHRIEEPCWVRRGKGESIGVARSVTNNRQSQRQTSSSPRQKECVTLGVGVTVISDPITICTKRMRDARGRGHIYVWSDQGCSAESNGGWPHTLSAYNTLTLKGIGDYPIINNYR